jgi:hypothetical protein
MNEYHLYKNRHLFKGDDHIGKYDPRTRVVWLREEFAGLKDDARAYFISRQGVCLKNVLAGSEVLPCPPPLPAFPPEVVALMSPERGTRTPEVIAWAQDNFTREEFDRCYEQHPPFKTQDDKTQDARQEEEEEAAPESAPAPVVATTAAAERMRKLNAARAAKKASNI